MIFTSCGTEDDVVEYYTTQNIKRTNDNKPSLIVNTIALGIESNWMEKLSEKTDGTYMQYDRKTLSEVDGND
jgi:hypothetical protein